MLRATHPCDCVALKFQVGWGSPRALQMLCARCRKRGRKGPLAWKEANRAKIAAGVLGRAKKHGLQGIRPRNDNCGVAGCRHRAARPPPAGDDRHCDRRRHDRLVAEASASRIQLSAALSDPGHRQIERTPVVARDAEPVGAYLAAGAGRNRRRRLSRRLAQTGSRQFSRRQRIGAGDRCA